MKKDRSKLEELLEKIIDEHLKTSRKAIIKIEANLWEEYKLPSGVFSKLISGDQKLSTLDQSVLFAISDAIYQHTELESIRTDHYFTNLEIKNSLQLIKDNYTKNKIELPVVFDNVVKVDDETYVTSVDIAYLAKLSDAQLIIYDPDSQRGLKYLSTNSGVVPAPILHQKNVNEIANHMLTGTYFPDAMTINCFSSTTEALIYDEKHHKLEVDKEAVISISDGYHRLRAAKKALLINPNLEQRMILTIRNYDTDTNRKFFGQINTYSTISKQRKKELKGEKYSDNVVRDLIRKSDLKGRVASSGFVSKVNFKELTTFDTLSFSIDESFNIQNYKEAGEVSKYLIEFFNYLLALYQDKFIDNPKEYKNTYSNQLIFAGYIQLAKILKDEGKEISDIEFFVDKIDFNNEELKDMIHNKARYNTPSTRRKMMNFFKEEARELNV